MANRFDKFLVIDVESTCWEGQPPEGQISEIIEIGICPVNIESLTPEDAQCIIVKPQKSEISEFCTKLTSLTAEYVAQGVPFSIACNELRSKYKSHKRLWTSWGDYDRRQFDRQCRDASFNAHYPFGITHLNAKNLFAIEQNLTKEVGMAEALKILEMELYGVHHRGIDDARNIAEIICHILKRGRTPS